MHCRSLMVTGGAGFIGSNFIRFLCETEPELRIVNLDALTYAGNLASLGDCLRRPGHEFVHGDITNSELVRFLLRCHQVDGIINFAAESHVDRSLTGAAPFVETNVKGTLALLTEARAAGVSRFLQVSTDEVYGALGPTGAFSELTPLSPNSPYSASKAAADHFVHAFHHSFGMDTIITRCSNNYGPYQFPEKLIPLMIMNARLGRPLPVYGDGLQVRDWLHVSDHCSGIWAAFQRGKSGEVYNFGGNNEMANIDLVKLILRHLQAPESLITHVADRPGHDRRYAVDAGKAKRELGWSPAISCDDGIAATVRWYQDNADWLESVTSGAYQSYYQKMYGSRLGDG